MFSNIDFYPGGGNTHLPCSVVGGSSELSLNVSGQMLPRSPQDPIPPIHACLHKLLQCECKDRNLEDCK